MAGTRCSRCAPPPGDTSASAALYAAYVGGPIRSVVLLPQGKVTPQQLAQPLGSGAVVLEIPGVFDDCMEVVEHLADHYRVALLNSKNAWRILGQESYAFEVAQWYDWDMSGKVLFVPIGNAGNITAVMSGFLKLKRLNIIDTLPRIFGVQSPTRRSRVPLLQRGGTGATGLGAGGGFSQRGPGGHDRQPRVPSPGCGRFAEEFEAKGGPGSFQVLQVTEQAIMDSMLLANRHGHIACTQGGEWSGRTSARLGTGPLEAGGERGVGRPRPTPSSSSISRICIFRIPSPRNTGSRRIRNTSTARSPVLSQADKDGRSPGEFTLAAVLAVAEKLGLEKK